MEAPRKLDFARSFYSPFAVPVFTSLFHSFTSSLIHFFTFHFSLFTFHFSLFTVHCFVIHITVSTNSPFFVCNRMSPLALIVFFCVCACPYAKTEPYHGSMALVEVRSVSKSYPGAWAWAPRCTP